MPIAMLILAMACFQVGAVLAKSLFPIVGASGTVALRLTFAALLLLAIRRPWRMRLSTREAGIIVVYGLALGWMNLFFYLSLRSVPLGIVVALEFTGPLTLALAVSRRAVDFAWILMVAAGLCALLPLGSSSALSATGVGCALAAGLCWAIYIQFGRKAGGSHGGAATALGMSMAALAIVPIGVAQAGARLFSPAILPTALAVAVLSSALPYSLETFAMPRLPTRTVGVLMSLGPALGALSGLAFLGERLTWLQWAAIGSIMAASAGSAATSRNDAAQPSGGGYRAMSAIARYSTAAPARVVAVVRNFGWAW